MSATSSPRTAVLKDVGRLLALAKPERFRLILGFTMLCIGSAMNLAFPWLLKDFVNDASSGGSGDAINRTVLSLLGIFAALGISIGLRFYFLMNAGESIVTGLRKRVYERLLEQEIGFFDTRKTGELLSRLASDAYLLQASVTSNLSMGLRNALTAVGGIVLLLITSPKLTLLMLLLIPPVALGAMLYGRRVRRLSREVQDAFALSSAVAEETLGGMRTVRSFAAERAEALRYAGAVDRSYELALRRARLGALFMGSASFAGYAATAVLLWYGGHQLVEGKINAGQLAAFLAYTMMVAFALTSLSDTWPELMKASGATERLFELLDRKPLMPLREGKVLSSIQGLVTLEDVSFSYPSRPDIEVLRHLTLTMRPGEIVALVGPSGAGKSTLAQILGRLYDPNQGTVRIDGMDLRELNPTWLRQQIGVVAQEPLLFLTSIADNIRYGRPDASQADIEAAARAANAEEFIRSFPDGYDTLVGERGVQLSGGQKQRIAIARAVLKDPRVLILDEATSALDAQNEHWVKEALDRLMRGRTTLIIAHRLSTVANAHRVIVMSEGQIVQTGTHRELMDQGGLYRTLVEHQFVAA